MGEEHDHAGHVIFVFAAKFARNRGPVGGQAAGGRGKDLETVS
jgi:hypothetical protein